MKKINIAYDYDYNEATDTITIVGNVDTIAVPDIIEADLEAYTQDFFDWAGANGKIATSSEDFVSWINNIVKSSEKAKIIAINTKYDSSLKTAEF